MQPEPGQPGGGAPDADAVGELDDRGAVSDGGHGALVAVREGHRRLALRQPADLGSGVRSYLQGQLRQRLAVGDRDVADREDPVLPGNA